MRHEKKTPGSLFYNLSAILEPQCVSCFPRGLNTPLLQIDGVLGCYTKARVSRRHTVGTQRLEAVTRRVVVNGR